MLPKYITQQTPNHLKQITSLLTSLSNCTQKDSFRCSLSALLVKRYYYSISEREKNNSTTLINNKQHQYFDLLKTSKRFSGPKRRSIQVDTTPLDRKFMMEWPKITLFGDSITRRSVDPENGCWAALIAHQVGNYFDVDARGFEGYNSSWGLELMPQLFPKSYLQKVEIFIPFFGHNDGWQGLFPGSVEHEEYEKNIRAIIKYLVDNGLEKRKIIMITPAWYHHESFVEFLKEIKSPSFGKDLEHAKKYGEIILRIAKENELDVVDFFDITVKQNPLKDIFCDGVHLSQKGARLLFQALMPIIEKKVEESFKKPLGDLWHVVPFDQHPKVEPVLRAHLERLKLQEEEAENNKKTSEKR